MKEKEKESNYNMIIQIQHTTQAAEIKEVVL